MAAKKAPRTRKPAKKAARKAAHARKSARSARPAARKAKVMGARASAGKTARTRTRKTPGATRTTRPSAKAVQRRAPPKAMKPAMPSRETKAGSSLGAAVTASSIPSVGVSPLAEARAAVAASQARLARRAAVLDEEDEASGGHNLLLGPRNVRPYHERKGEQYMGQDQLGHFRAILNSWKRDLMEEVDRTMTHMKDEAANPPDPNDRATLESEFALELRTRDRERKLIRKIDEALNRIDDGSYGYCIETGEPIGVKRLEARPVATLCIEAQERRERREKQYGDRDDWYR